MRKPTEVYFKETRLNSIIEINDIVVMRYYEFQNDVVFNDFEVHNFWEFVYVDKGQIQVYADDNCFKLLQGEMVFHKPGQIHDLSGDGKTASNVLVGCFFCENEAMEYFEDKIVKINKKNKELLSSIIYETEEAFEAPQNDTYLLEMTKKDKCQIGAQQMLKIHLEELLIRLLREADYEHKHERAQSISRDNFETELVDKIISYMNDNVGNNIRREDICAHFNLSITSLETTFKKVTSQSTMKYFSELKISVAKRMIRESSYNFTQISEMLGFNTPHYFSSAFKKNVGMTPSEYANSVKAIIDNMKSERKIDMESYKIRNMDVKDYSGAEKAMIDKTPWGGEYKPDCYAQVVFVNGEGFYAKMYCKEESPLMTYKPGDFSDDVCDDSCMEWFIDFAPGNPKGYINYEGTACAALNCGVGTGRNDRTPINELIGVLPDKLNAGREGEYWWIEYFLSLDIIEKVFGKIDTNSGAVYRGNFYKCGELTETPHYLAWSQIDLPDPDYHCPKFFGEFIME